MLKITKMLFLIFFSTTKRSKITCKIIQDHGLLTSMRPGRLQRHLPRGEEEQGAVPGGAQRQARIAFPVNESTGVPE